MSSISSTTGLSNAWANASTQRVRMQAKLFARVDADSSGGVDKTELQTLLTDISKKTGKTLDATQVFANMGKDSSGSLSSEELAKALKGVMPPPPSTVDFAQKRSGEPGSKDLFKKVDVDASGTIDEAEMTAFTDKMKADTGRDSPTTFAKLDANSDGQLTPTEFDAGKPAGSQQASDRVGGPPPPGEPGGPGGAGGSGRAKGTESSTATSTTYDPLDTNQDGTVSELERLAGALKDLVSTIESSNSNTGSQANDNILKLAKQVYAQIASFATSGASSTLDAMA